mgnify:CR=1 FL=1
MENKKTVYINFFDGIDLVKVNKFIQFTTEVIALHNPTELYYFISSSGGDVDSGFVLYNFLVSLQEKLTVTMHNTGTIDSIANVVFVGANERFSAPNASFLFHGVSMNIQGACSRTALKEHLSRLEGMENRIANTVSKHSKLTESELTALFQQGEGKDVNFALDKEIIQKIKAPSIPVNAIHLAMTF